MSMWIHLARVTPEAFDVIRRDPHLLGPLLLQQADDVLARLGVTPEDISGLDYDSAAEMIEATAELEQDEDGDEQGAEDDDGDGDGDEDGEDEDGEDVDDEDEAEGGATLAEDDDEEPGDVVFADLQIDGTLGYDAGFGSAFFLTPAAAKRAASSSAALGLDDEAKAIVQAAADRGHYIVGVVS
jgi:hypothetical protein